LNIVVLDPNVAGSFRLVWNPVVTLAAYSRSFAMDKESVTAEMIKSESHKTIETERDQL